MSRTNRKTSCNRTKASGGRKFDKRTLTADTWKQQRAYRKRTEDARNRNMFKKVPKAKPIKSRKSSKKRKSSTPSFGWILIGFLVLSGLNMMTNTTPQSEQVQYDE